MARLPLSPFLVLALAAIAAAPTPLRALDCYEPVRIHKTSSSTWKLRVLLKENVQPVDGLYNFAVYGNVTLSGKLEKADGTVLNKTVTFPPNEASRTIPSFAAVLNKPVDLTLAFCSGSDRFPMSLAFVLEDAKGNGRIFRVVPQEEPDRRRRNETQLVQLETSYQIAPGRDTAMKAPERRQTTSTLAGPADAFNDPVVQYNEETREITISGAEYKPAKP